MTCPYCTAVVPDEDLFCEECGQKLAHRPSGLPPLCLCGAPDGDLDDDGYCLQCGRRCRAAPGEHQEEELSADFAAVSDRGLHHPRNEDRARIASDSGRFVMVVCDGVSNSSSPDAAAAAASERLANGLAAGANLEVAFAEASDAVRKLASDALAGCEPSTTAIAAVVESGRATIGWIGDSRAYWIAETGSRQLTIDHSWLNDVVASGELTYEQAAKSSQVHAITRWLGADAGPQFSPETRIFEMPGPGWLLLCTDGLWNYLGDFAELSGLVLPVSSDMTALQIARRLVAFANEKGGRDNVTAALLRFS